VLFKINLLVVSQKNSMKMPYIMFALLLFLSASCQKEVIRPEAGSASEDTRMLRTGSVVDSGDQDSEDDTSDGDGDITDPNSDKDESVRRKRR
jgi:hypothetical protein